MTKLHALTTSMRYLKRNLYFILYLTISTHCGGRTGAATYPTLVINEFLFTSSSLSENAKSHSGWVEVYNDTGDEVNLNDYAISIDTIANLTQRLPEMYLPNGEFTVIYFSGDSSSGKPLHTPFTLDDTTRYVALLHHGTVVDLLSFHFPPDKGESIGRNPLKTSEWIHYRFDQVTVADHNFKPGLWKKITNHTQFEPRDSSPNACLVFNGRIWVFAGYRFTGIDWESRSDVWSSADGRSWTLENDDPPFHPYSAFIVFKNKMWAFNSAGCYSSKDGINWTNEAPEGFPGGYGARVTVFNGELWFCNEGLIGKSSNGVNWEIVLSELPWKDKRLWPGFLAHNGKLYFFGGGINYLTGKDYYYNDVWSSEDGKRWQQLTPNAAWAGRFWFSYASFDNKIWLMGGWNYYKENNLEYGNLNDVWVTENGANWRQLLDSCQWPNRHSPLTWVRNNSLYVSSGYGGGGTPRMYNDIWVCTNKRDPDVGDIAALPEMMPVGADITLDNTTGLNVVSSDEGVIKIDQTTLTAVDTGRATLRIFLEGNERYYPYYLEKDVKVIEDPAATVNAYPNPLNVELRLSLPFKPGSGDYLEIYSAVGQLEEHKTLERFADTSIYLPISLSAGSYLYKVKNNGRIYTGRLIVQ